MAGRRLCVLAVATMALRGEGLRMMAVDMQRNQHERSDQMNVLTMKHAGEVSSTKHWLSYEREEQVHGSLPQMSGVSPALGLYAPMAGIAALMVAGNVVKGTKDWSKLTRSRIRTTYTHFALSTIIWSGTAFLLWKLGLVPMHSWAPMLISLMGVAIVYKMSALDYDNDRTEKILHFYGFGIDLVIRLICAQHGYLDVLVQAAVLTAADFAAISCVVAASPSTNFLWIGGFLGGGLGLLIGASLINMIWRTSSVMHIGFSYFGAALFSGYLLQVVKEASKLPGSEIRITPWGTRAPDFDPVHHALQLYLDVVNIFMYIVR
ncbi:hypothetical protein GUITHDRAFT_106057 [Guillardia theta CCMP2712]|uniref:Uncharacterized protein n=1 Tax=Guillardia theta (strain CCMP2712) TaxID=905079 RepID=L1JHH6_GUITC|nr:hypothetical protein GUITHDRAFT_106057 [Guillardia theta CCMP2712]EKX47973.1 hypothetical protein GUITHDRAFT_106057 [Guillardia theta CCMP2712]|eukprot:XP_005834953.1 hypothetical protein GUITHDRAFT_106057 [Guillardia theta CCMP2712]